MNYQYLTGGKKKKERKPFSERVPVAPKETTDSDWGTIYKPAAQSRPRGSKKPSSSKKSQSQKAKSPTSPNPKDS